MKSEDIKKLVDLFNSPIKDIKRDNEIVIIEFENGEEIPLYGGSYDVDLKDMDLQIKYCSFCGITSILDDILFTIDDKSFICLNCNILAMETFLKNGADVNLKLDGFSEVIDEIKNIGNNIDNKKGDLID